MHIAIVHRDLHQLTRGGICTVYRSLAAQMASRRHAVTMVTQATHRPVVIDGVNIAALPRTGDLTGHRAAVADLLTTIQPDIVECSTWEAETLAYLSQPAGRRAPVLVRGEFSAATLGARDLADAERDLVRRTDQVIAVSDYTARDLAAAYGIPVAIRDALAGDPWMPPVPASP